MADPEGAGRFDRRVVDGQGTDRVPVGVAEFAVVTNPTTLVTTGLGSCVAVGMTDGETAAGLLHAMLPTAEDRSDDTPAKYADTGVPALRTALLAAGADPEDLVAKIAGGSQMIAFRRGEESIGDRNVRAVRTALQRADVALVAEDVGGEIGRTVRFSRDGAFEVRTAAAPRRTL